MLGNHNVVELCDEYHQIYWNNTHEASLLETPAALKSQSESSRLFAAVVHFLQSYLHYFFITRNYLFVVDSYL